MKHISILFLLVLLIISSGANCKKNNPEIGLPPATLEGKNTAGFLLNGEVWLPKGDNGYPNLNFYYDETYRGGHWELVVIDMNQIDVAPLHLVEIMLQELAFIN